MSEGKSGIARDRIAQMLSGFVERRGIAGGSEPVTPYEFRIRHRVLAVSWAALDHWSQRPVQCGGNLFRNLVLKVGQATNVEIPFPCEASAPGMVIKQFHREPQDAF